MSGSFPGVSVVKNPPAKSGSTGSIPGWGRSPGEGNGNPLQYSHLENSMDRGAWQVTVYGGRKRVRYNLATTTTTKIAGDYCCLSVQGHWRQCHYSITNYAYLAQYYDL